MHALSLCFIESIIVLLPFTWADYIIDSADDTVKYSNPSRWTPLGFDAAYNGTMSEASCRTSDACSFTIPFDGSGIIIYGRLYGGPTNFTVSVDGEMDTAPTFLPDGKVIPNVTLYATQPESLPLANHNLTISLVDWDRAITLFDFDYASVNTTAPARVSSPAATSLSGGSSSSTGNSSPSQPASSHSHSSVGAVVGGILAGLAVVAIILAFLYFWKKRHALVHEEIDPEPNPMPPDTPSLMAYSPYISPLTATSPLYTNRSSNFHSEQQNDNVRITAPSVADSLITPVPPTSTACSTDLHPSVPSTKKDLDDDVTSTRSPPSLQTSSATNQLTDDQADFVNSLYSHNIPAPAIARIVQRMMAGQEIGELDEISSTASNHDHGNTTAPAAPPKYSESES